MAGSQKEFELLFKLKAALGPNFNGAFKSAINTNNQLRDSMKNVNSLQSKIDGYTKQSAAIDKNKERLALLNAEHDRLQQELQQTGEPTDALRKKLERNESQIQQTTAKIQEQERQLNSYAEELREAGVNTDNLEEANGRLQKSYEKLQSSQQTLQKINEKQQQVQQSISKTKGQLLGTVGAVAAAATSFFALDAATEEYRVNQAKLNTAYQAAGMGASAAQEAYAGFYKILGDNDTATEASQLLAKLTKSEQDIAKWTAIAAGVNGTFGDSLPIEGLIESANETARVGQITGVLADAINWASKEGETFGVTLKENTKANKEWNKAVSDCQSAEDYFNLALQQCGSEAERNKLIMDALQGSYKDATAAFYENNKQIMQTRQSQIIYNDILADLGRIAGTVKGIILEMLGVTTDGTVKANSVISRVQETVNKLADNPELIKTITKVVAGLAALRAGMLGAKLVGLSTESGLLSLVGKLVGLRAGLIESAATSAGFAAKLKTAGSGVLSYFGNVKGALGGVGSAIGNIFSGNRVIGAVTGFMGNVKASVVNGFMGLATKAGGALTGAGTKLLGLLLKPFSLIGGKLGPILGTVGTAIANSPLGKIGGLITRGITGAFSKATTLIAPLGNAVKTVLGPIGNLAKTALGPLGGIAGKILPVVGVITTIITVIKLVQTHLEEVRSFIQRTFGDEALAVFDKIVAVITNVGNTIKNVSSGENIGAARDKIQELFGDKGAAVFDTFVNVLGTVKNAVSEVVGFITANVVPVAEQVLQVITTQVIPGIVSFIQAAAPTIMQIIQSVADFIGAIIPVIGSFIAGLMPIISEIITFISTYVLPIISELFSFICSTVLPAISDAIQAILPVVQNVLQTLLPAIQTALSTIWNIVSPIIQGILAAVQFVMPTIQAIVQSGVQAISGVISGIVTVLNGIITFITGVFSGNWRQAWEGIKSIFSGIWQAIKSVCTGAINGIISAVNTVIRGLNKVKVPDWVPGVGGKGINISEIPMLAKGSSNTPDTFIAGEAGPELITNAPGRTVFTASQTRSIMAAQNTAATTAAAVAPTTAPTTTAQTVNNYNTAPEVTAGAGNSGGGAKNVTINNNPTIVVNGDKPEDLDAKLEENNKRLLRDVEELLDEKEDKERRQKYD